MADTNDEDQTPAEEEEATEAETPEAAEEGGTEGEPLEGDVVDDAPEAEGASEDGGVDISQPAVPDQPASDQRIAHAELSDLTPTSDAYSRDNLDLILNVKVTLSMEVGSTHIPIRRLLQLTQGSVVELDQMAGQPMNVLVNGTHIAQGEVVLVNDRVGIRLTDVISPSERVKSIN